MYAANETSTGQLSAGHAIVAQLEREGVERAYAVPGESFLDVLDGLHDSTITTVVTRHEGGSGFMAMAEGRLTGRPGIAMVTRGPGAANAFIAVHTAWQDATPMVLFVGLVPVADRGRFSFQEFDLTGWFGSTAKKVVTLDDPTQAAAVVADAMHTARTGRPGPVVIGLPEDVIRQPTSTRTVVPIADPELAVSEAVRERLQTMLSAARRPVMVVGGEGWSKDSGPTLSRWAAEQGIPVLGDFRAYDAVPHVLEDGPGAYVGFTGYGRSDHVAEILDTADLAIYVGAPRTDVGSDGYTRGLDTPTVVAVPGEPLGHSGRLDALVTVVPQAFVDALVGLSAEAVEADWLPTAQRRYQEFITPQPTPSTEFVDMDAVMMVLRDELDDDAVITYGAGNHSVWPSRYLRHTSPASLVAPRNGAMGVGIPAAVAAAMVHPGRQVVSIAGDGCFMMNGQEIATAVGYDAPFIAIVVDNGVFATIREHQERHYPGRPSGTHLTNPDFAAWAESYGAYGERVETEEAFGDAFRRAVASGRPAVLHLIQDPDVRAPETAVRDAQTGDDA